MKTKLVFPGFWTCSAPYLSLPSLTAFLRMHGKDVEQIESFRRISLTIAFISMKTLSK